MTDARGKLQWAAEIDTYGELRDVHGYRQACPFRWPGQYEDAETGLYYNRFRYYDPDAGVYVSQDPIGLSGGLALYAYVHDPLVATGVLGLHQDWAPHAAAENDAISKGLHFNAGDGVI